MRILRSIFYAMVVGKDTPFDVLDSWKTTLLVVISTSTFGYCHILSMVMST